MIRRILPIFLALAVAVPAVAQTQNYDSRKLATLISEVETLRDEVGRLRSEVEALHSENARLRSEVAAVQNSASKSDFAAFKAEIFNKLNAFAAEIEARFQKQNAETNAQLKNVETQVNSALATAAKQAAAAANSGKKSGGNDIPKPRDVPESGIEYKIKAGDTLSRIARKNGSKVDWILYANPNLKPDHIEVGKTIVVPVE